VRGPVRGKLIQVGARRGLGPHSGGANVLGGVVQMCKSGSRCRLYPQFSMSVGFGDAVWARRFDVSVVTPAVMCGVESCLRRLLL
jgi:hypothetical protein